MATKRVEKKVPVPADDRGGSLNSSQRLVVKARAYGAEDTDGTTPQANQIPALDFEEYLMPPTDPAVWSECPEQSTRLTRSIDILATNVVGFGWEIAAGVRPGHKLDAKQRKQFEIERAVLEEFFEYANPTLPVTSVFKHGLVDCETTGDGYYEVPRNMKGDPDGLYYVQSVTTRVRKNGDGFVQGRGDEKRYFKNYGDKRIIGAFDGKVYADKDGTWVSKDKKPADLPMKMRATELLHIRVFTTRSIHYGIPRWAACAPAIVGNRAAAERNVNFFANDAPQPLDAKVLTSTGWKTMGEMEIGSQVIGSDGKPHNVIGIYPQGVKDIYRVEFEDGSAAECTLGHLWTVSNAYDRQNGVTRDMTLHQLLEDGLAYPSGTSKWAVPLVEPVEYEPRQEPLPVDPYLLGILLGDGSFRDGRVTLAAAREDTDELEGTLTPVLPGGVALARRDRGGWSEFHFKRAEDARHAPNRMRELVRDLGLLEVIGGDKFIPESYLRSSVEDRIAMLQGLVDSDGCVSDTAVRYVTTSRKLAEGVADLVGSLGGVTTVRPVKDRSTLQVTITKLPSWIVPARLARKASKYKVKDVTRVRTIVKAFLVRQAEAQCIKLDTAEGLYVTDQYVVTHNTPRLVITVSGGKLGAEASKMIEGFLRREGKGTKNAHRCLLLQVEGKKLTLGQENKVDIQVTPLTVGTVEDASFLQYRKANDEEIREAFGITEPYYTSANANRAGAEVGRRITEEGMFEPIRREIEYLINQTLCRDLGATVARFRFIRPNSLDELEDVNVDQRMAQSWAMTPNEMRAKRGLPPLEDPLLGDKPFPWLAAAALAGGLPGIPAKVRPGPKPGSENQGPKEPKPPLKRGAPVAGKPRRLRTKSVEDAEAVGSMLKGVLEMFGIEANVQVGSDERPLESVIAEAQALAQEGSDVPQAG